MLEDVKEGRNPVERLAVKSGSRISFVRVEEIDWIEAAGNYLRLHVGGEVHLLRETMSRLEARLDAKRFLRIHRSTMVNIERIQELQPAFHGEYVVLLRDKTELTLSRGYRDKLQELLGRTVMSIWSQHYRDADPSSSHPIRSPIFSVYRVHRFWRVRHFAVGWAEPGDPGVERRPRIESARGDVTWSAAGINAIADQAVAAIEIH